MKTTNLVYNCSKVAKNGEQYDIKIRLNDVCKNGHQDFSITGTIYKAGNVKCERNMISGGAIGDKIAVNFPEFAIFNKLHLSDYRGVPMYAVEKGMYHLENGFQRYEDGKDLKSVFCEYYRVTPNEFDILSPSCDKIEYTLNLRDLGIFERWSNEAKEAIKLLEKLTGDEFVVDSPKVRELIPPLEEIQKHTKKKESGYYTPEAKKQRDIEKRESEIKKCIDSINADADNTILKANSERAVKLEIARIFGVFDNFIYYDHKNTISLNWLDYKRILTIEEVTELKEKINYSILPENLTIEIYKK